MQQFETPILFLIFNRPYETAQVFAAIANVRPKRLYIAADGPRYVRADEYALCMQARAIVTAVNWPCEVITLFRDTNLGCGKAVSSAISWFFEQVEEGIILEDDCLPHPTFFSFCRDNLVRYRHDQRVMMVSGYSYLHNYIKNPRGAYLSHYYSIWGWATWRRAWQHYDFTMKAWGTTFFLSDMQVVVRHRGIALFWQYHLQSVACNRVDTWDFQWAFACLQRGYAVVPFGSLITNIGTHGSHTSAVGNNFHHTPVTAYVDDGRVPQPSYTYDKQLFIAMGMIEPFVWYKQPARIMRYVLKRCGLYEAIYKK